MKIVEKVDKLAAKIALEKATSGDGSSSTGDNVQALAVATILGGKESPAWEAYMKMIVDIDKTDVPAGLDRPDQLARLKLDPNDPKHDDPDMKKAAAYLVSNGTCGATTSTKTNNFMTNESKAILDEDLPV